MKLKTLDLSNYIVGTEPMRKNFVSDLGKAFESIGFAAIEGHDFTNADRDLLQNVIKQFFNQDNEFKMESFVPGAKGQRGFTPFWTEHAKGETRPDLKEFFQWGPMNAEERGLDKNVLVPNIKNMDSAVSIAYNKLERI